MSFFANNIKLLRKRKHLSQDAVAKELNLTRSSLSGYENFTAQAPYDVLVKLSDFYNISIDVILKKDLLKLSDKNLANMEENGSFDIHGNRLRTLVVSSNDNTNANADLVPIQALSIYNTSLNDPEFIKELPLMKLPFLSDKKTYRAFPVVDESMPPVTKGSYVIGEFFNDWSNITNGDFFIVVSETKGISFKQVFYSKSEEKSIQLCSSDPIFEPFNINLSEVKEIWKFVSYISTEIEDISSSHDHLVFTVKELQRKINTIEKHLKF